MQQKGTNVLFGWRYLKAIWRMMILVMLPIILLTQSPSRQQDETLLHIFPHHQGAPLPDGFYVYQRLNERGIAIKSITPAPDSLIVRLASSEQTFAAREALRSSFPQAKIITQQPPKPAPFWRQKLTQKTATLG